MLIPLAIQPNPYRVKIWTQDPTQPTTQPMAISVHYIGGFDEFSAYKDF